MRVEAVGLKDNKRLKFEARGVTEECRSLTLAATEPAEVETLARLFRYFLHKTSKGERRPEVAHWIDEMLDKAGFEG